MAELHTIDWELRLGFLIHDVSRLRRSAFDRCLKPLNVTRSQWWVLAYLSREDGMTQSQLAIELDLGKVAVGGLIICWIDPQPPRNTVSMAKIIINTSPLMFLFIFPPLNLTVNPGLHSNITCNF